ncbi:MAG: DUF1549 domain-containing protein, partial [Gemmataceae bacterium]|nr:DUF1549 domain-containing protein [Gemmataceae bacterium]
MAWRLAAVVAIIGVGWPGRGIDPPSAQTKAPAAEDADWFSKRVRPILEANCFRCHSHAAKKSKGGLMLDSRTSLLKGGNNGPAIVPGHPEKSLLIRAVEQADDELRMPPQGKLNADEVAVLRQWVRDGAPWPGGAAVSVRRPGDITAEDRAWWAFQPVRTPRLPECNDPDWSVNPIDRFIKARLEREGLVPAPLADPRALVRRLFFDLTGLPPTPKESDDFAAAWDAPQADRDALYRALVDRLLASPRYGERMARLWLDLARYAESDGFRLDSYRPNAWRYRDWVIRAFNRDLPFDQFLRLQLAGDELAPDDPESLVATGFLCHGIYEYNQRDARTQWDDMINEVTDLVGDSILALGISCARCHDHKYDPILQKDYYRLRAFFAPLMFYDDKPLATAREQAEYRQRLAAWEKRAGPILKAL